jgi:DNA-directed RNA polymerase subunit RPC12/RpoP
MPDVYKLVRAILYIDTGLLIFNIMPIYPLDGGQILRSVLWFVLGRARSLMVATILGLIGIVGFVVLAFWRQDLWLGAIAVFMLLNCWGGLQHARALLKVAKLPRREGFACPNCSAAPPVGNYWRCGKCGQPFDTFQTFATCPHCSTQFAQTKCLDCGRLSPINSWMVGSLAPAKF